MITTGATAFSETLLLIFIVLSSDALLMELEPKVIAPAEASADAEATVVTVAGTAADGLFP